jgi:hypothetical protein
MNSGGGGLELKKAKHTQKKKKTHNLLWIQ